MKPWVHHWSSSTM